MSAKLRRCREANSPEERAGSDVYLSLAALNLHQCSGETLRSAVNAGNICRARVTALRQAPSDVTGMIDERMMLVPYRCVILFVMSLQYFVGRWCMVLVTVFSLPVLGFVGHVFLQIHSVRLWVRVSVMSTECH